MSPSRQELLAECLACPLGIDIRHALAQCSGEFTDRQLSPSGRPLLCCRIRLISAVNREQSTPAGGNVGLNGGYGPRPRGLKLRV
jgi:hypothetical protein